MSAQDELQQHADAIGSIMVNFASLETFLRMFLAAQDGQRVSLPNEHVDKVDWNRMTYRRQLAQLIREYNQELSAEEATLKVDVQVVEIRHAFAHGRIYSHGNDALPYTLCLFGQNNFDGKVRVDFFQTMTLDWLQATRDRIKQEHRKVIECHKKRGYGGYQ
jgi:hypothetical protein